MPAGHVRKETDAERKRLGEEAENFDRDHDRPEHGMYTASQMGQVVFESLCMDGGDLDHAKGDDCESGRDRDVRRCRGSKRDESHKVHDQDKEKGRQEVGQVLDSARSHVRQRHLVAQEHDEDLEQVTDSLRHPMLPVLPGRIARHGKKQECREEQEEHMFRNGEVECDASQRNGGNVGKLKMTARKFQLHGVLHMVEQMTKVELIPMLRCHRGMRGIGRGVTELERIGSGRVIDSQERIPSMFERNFLLKVINFESQVYTVEDQKRQHQPERFKVVHPDQQEHPSDEQQQPDNGSPQNNLQEGGIGLLKPQFDKNIAQQQMCQTHQSACEDAFHHRAGGIDGHWIDRKNDDPTPAQRNDLQECPIDLHRRRCGITAVFVY